MTERDVPIIYIKKSPEERAELERMLREAADAGIIPLPKQNGFVFQDGSTIIVDAQAGTCTVIDTLSTETGDE